MIISFLTHHFRNWFGNKDGIAAVEAALIFPLLALLLLGTYDIGNAILANQKTIRASQITADLVTRVSEVDTAMIGDAIDAGELAMQPLQDLSTYGVDIVSIRFDNTATPQVEWRETRNMVPNPSVLSDVASLATANSGVLVVTVQYTYEPLFVGFSMKDFTLGLIPMQETAFARGRGSAVVERI